MLKKIVLLFLLILIILPLGFFFWWSKETLPVDPSQKETQIFVIPQGWGISQIGERLQQEGLIKNQLVFKIMVVKEGLAKELQAGDFRLSPSMNLIEITQTLTHGTIDTWVRIPEGLRREEIGKIITDSFTQQEAEFDLKDFLNKTKNKEGFLFPDTYLIPKDATPENIIKIMEDNFEKKFTTLTLNTNLSKNQIVILASLIEREAKYDKDRAIVAGILLKRLKKGWPLQVDASVQYAKATEIRNSEKWWLPITSQDIKETDSPFNTYKNQGLPPTPICSPGLSSLKAVANPQDSDYWFYLSDNAGNIHFAKTLEEQEENINRYLSS